MRNAIRELWGAGAATLVTLVVLASSSSAAATTLPNVAFNARVTISDHGLVLTPAHARRGAFAKLRLINKGKRTHVVRVGVLHVTLKPGAQRSISFYLDTRGRYPIKVDKRYTAYLSVR